MADNTGGNDKLIGKETVAKAQQLIEYLEAGKATEARKLIDSLNQVREDSLYQELGKLTREFHETLKQIDIGGSFVEIPSARNRLEYVIKLTEDAANQTMDGIENTMPLSNAMAEEAAKLLEDWTRFKNRQMSVEEFRDLYTEMMQYLERVKVSADEIHDNLQNVIVAQNYQDLSGQAIKKVMHVVSELEGRLVSLVQIAAEANRSFSGEELILSEDEVQHKIDDARSHEVKGQDEVDDLLSSLGF